MKFSFEFNPPAYFSEYSKGELYSLIVGVITSHTEDLRQKCAIEETLNGAIPGITAAETHLLHSFTKFKLED